MGFLALGAVVAVLEVLATVLAVAFCIYASLALIGVVVFSGIGVRRLIARRRGDQRQLPATQLEAHTSTQAGFPDMTAYEYPYSPEDFPDRLRAYPPPPGWPTAVDAYGRPLSDRSKVTAGLLGIFFGSIGLGRFYLGYTGMGIAQIAVTWLTCGIGGLWPLIDAFMILAGKVHDAQGCVLRD